MASNGDASASGLPPGGPHFLESEWVIWEHRSPDKNSKSYEDNMEKLCEVATIEDFWRAFNNIPKPSMIFFDGRTKKKFANRSVESFSLFKKGIKPEWEDAANRTGAEWFCRKMFPAPQLVSATSATRHAPPGSARERAPPCSRAGARSGLSKRRRHARRPPDAQGSLRCGGRTSFGSASCSA